MNLRYWKVGISVKPVISKTSMIASLTPVRIISPCLFMVFWADSRTRSPAEERYSMAVKSNTSFWMPAMDSLRVSSS